MIEKYGYSYISMKKYLREIEISGIILLFIGTCDLHHAWSNSSNINQFYDFRKKHMTLQEAQQAVDQWIKTYGIRYFSELTNMAVLTEEVGELARVMARKYGDQSFKEGEKDNLGEEMADVLWVLLCLANQTGVNLTEELKKSIEKKTKRDKERHINNVKLK